MLESIMVPAVIVTVIGIVAGVGLSIATIVFAAPVDETEEKLRAALPGANCGACGFSGCDGYAKALADGTTEANLCIPGGQSTENALADILGVEVDDEFRRVATFVRCQGACQFTSNKMDYAGANTCYGANQIFGGPAACQYGCMGLGDCVKVCDYNALHIKDGVAFVDPYKCVGCLKCVGACPKNLIKLLPAEDCSHVACSNLDKGGAVRKICTVGCISCSRCVKACPVGAVKLENNVAVIDPKLCENCGACVEACPQHCIVDMNAVHKKEKVEVSA